MYFSSSTPEEDRKGSDTAIDLGKNALNAIPERLDFVPLIHALGAYYAAKSAYILSQAGNPDHIEKKPDNSSVTNVDKEIEKDLQEIVKRVFPQLIFIGEESWEDLGYTPERAASSKHLVVVDPIDGTSHFIRGDREGFASVLGIWEQTSEGYSPQFGSVYCADQNCLYYTEGEGAFRFDITSGTTEIFAPKLLPINDQIIFTSRERDNGVTTSATDQQNIVHLKGRASVPDLMALIRGEGHACVTRGKLWDVAGVLALADHLGFKVYSSATLEEVTALTVGSGKPGAAVWELSEPVVICRPEQHEIINKCIISAVG